MFCDEVLELIEPIATGDHTPEPRIAAHLETCVHCAASLDAARRLERMIEGREVAGSPPQFTGRVLARVRRERWRREQWLDAGFNIAVAALAFLVLGGIWVLMRRTGLTTVGEETLEVVAQQFTTMSAQVAASLPMYGGAAGLLAAALGIWWWAERDASV